MAGRALTPKKAGLETGRVISCLGMRPFQVEGIHEWLG